MSDYCIAKAIDIENLSRKARAQFDLDLAAGAYLLTPKFDGCAVHIELNDGRIEQCVSGSGKPVRSLDHALKELLQVFPSGRVVLDAEAWVPGTEFQEISGLFRRHTSDSRLQLKVFNGYFIAGRNQRYEARLADISQALCYVPLLYTHTAARSPAFDLEHATVMARAWQQAGGFDGCVLHHRDAPYFQGRAKYESVKIKPLLSFDLEVVGVDRAIGEKTGRATCALVCRWKDGGVQEVATGLSHAQQADPGQFIGKIIEVRAMGLTSDGKLREPRFCGVREDKLSAEY
jgi:ATP-dependent DNA ligase